jgi:thiamine-monophosphate kinase
VISGTPDQTIADLGEQQLLQRLYQYCDTAVVGDDAAVLAIEPTHEVVVTTDMLVDGTHFSVGLAMPGIQTTTPFDVGWRSAAANLSDLAAMGAQPLGLTIALGLPPQLPVQFVDGFYQGLKACLDNYGTPIIGGDICRAPTWIVSITAIGQVHPRRKIQRSQARPGDVICVTGCHGAARAGLALLLNEHSPDGLSPEEYNALIQSHQRPVPRLDIPPLIWAIDPEARVAGMDSSDGLADAVLQICRASGVGAILDGDRLPMPNCFRTMGSLSDEDRVHYTLYGGEDFELVLCLEEPLAAKLRSKLDGSLRIIGKVQTHPTVKLVYGNNLACSRTLSLEKGFQHFTS